MIYVMDKYTLGEREKVAGKAHHIGVQSFHVVRIHNRDASHNESAPIASLHDILIVRESLHEFLHDLGMLDMFEASLVRVRREAVSRKRGGNHVETSVIQQRNHFVDLRKAARPSVEEQQRDGVGFGRPGMHKMHVKLSESMDGDRRYELRILVQSGLFFPPVIASTPEIDQFVDLAHCDSIIFGPLLVGNVQWKTRELEFTVEEIELRIRDMDLASEWFSVMLLRIQACC